MKFIVDMNLSPGAAPWLTLQGYDAIHVKDIGMQSAPDSEIFKVARQEHRIIVTADLDFPRILAMTGSHSPSLILFRGGNYSDQEIILLLESS